MVADVRITGAEDFKKLAARLREAGDVGTGLRKELYKRIDQATVPLRAEIKKAELEKLPKRGGLAKLVAARRISVSKRNVGNNAGVRLYQSGGLKAKALRDMDAGRLRHPLFGNRSRWYEQQIEPGFWSETLASSESEEIVRTAILAAINDISKKLT